MSKFPPKCTILVSPRKTDNERHLTVNCQQLSIETKHCLVGSGHFVALSSSVVSVCDPSEFRSVRGVSCQDKTSLNGLRFVFACLVVSLNEYVIVMRAYITIKPFNMQYFNLLCIICCVNNRVVLGLSQICDRTVSATNINITF